MKKFPLLPQSALIIFLLFGVYSCAPPIYFPNGINAPLLSEKGQLIVSGAMNSSGTDIQAAASISDKIGVIFNTDFADFTRNSHSSITSYNSWTGTTTTQNRTYESRHTHSFYEGGVGIYSKVGKRGRVEAFGLIGFGSAKSSAEGILNTARYSRFAIQSDIGIEASFFEGIISCRAGYLHMNPQYSDNGYKGQSNSGDLSSMFIDPAITIRMGWKGFKFFTQFGLSCPLGNVSFYEWNRKWGSLGLQVRINNL